MSADDMTPIGAAINTLNNAMQTLCGLIDDDIENKPTWMLDVIDAKRMLDGVAPVLTAAERTMEGQQAQLRDMRDYNLEQERRITELQQENATERARLIEIAEGMKKITFARIDASTAEHLNVGIVLAQLKREPQDFARPMGVHMDEPRAVAAGGR